MKKNFNYIFKRILIGTGIAFLLMIIKGNLIGNVYALDYNQTFSNNENYISYSLPNSNDLYNQNDIFWTNIFPDYTIFATNPISMDTIISLQTRSLTNPDNGPLSTGSTMGHFYDNFEIRSNNDDTFVGVYKIQLNFGTFTSNVYDGETSFNRSTAFPLNKDTDYSMLLEIQKTQNLTFYANSDSIQLSPESIVFKVNYLPESGYSGNNDYNFTNYFDITNLVYLPPSSIGENAPRDLAYIKIDFKLKDNLPNNSYRALYLNSISFDVGTIAGLNSQRATPFVFNGFSEINRGGYYRLNQLSFIKGGDILVSTMSDSINGSDVNSNLDSISQEDLKIKNKKRVCSNTDIVCHLQNIFDSIFDIFVRIGNIFRNIISTIIDFLSYLFLPSLPNLDYRFNSLKNMFNDKLGFLIDSFDILTYFKDTLLSVQATDTFSFSGVRMPIWDIEIIPSFSFSFSSILSNETLNQAHNVLYLVLNGLLILGFVKFCYNNVMEILGGVGNDIG